MNFKEYKTCVEKDIINETIEIKIPNSEEVLTMKTYLPQDEKARFVSFTISQALDNIGCVPPLRLDTFFAIALVKFYTNLELEDDDITHAGETYDILEQSGLLHSIVTELPSEEYDFVEQAVNKSAKDIEKYNNSLAGLMTAMNNDATNLNNELNDILEKIKNKEGLEELAVVKDIMGSNKSKKLN